MRLFMKVLKNLFGTNKKISANEIAIRNIENKAVTLDNFLNNATIYESGSNNNGSWIKYTNGIMIIFQTKIVKNVEAVVSDGYLYRGNLGTMPDFPVPFIDIPIVIYTLTNAFKLLMSGQEGEPTKVRAFEYNNAPALMGFHSATSFGSTVKNIKINVIAIGRWK